jgi:hypothetical protein
MKKVINIIIALLCAATGIQAQEINWRALNPNHKNLIGLHTGIDFSTMYGLNAARLIPGKIPVMIGTEISIPFGKQVLDDWKINLNGQAELWHNTHFSLGIKPGISLLRYESAAARFYNISGNVNGTFGYFRPKWGLATELSYNKPIGTHIHHDLLKTEYPGIRDGWYSGAGGVIGAGLKAHVSIRSLRFCLKAGRVFGQYFKNNPTIPYYLDVSLGLFPF